MQPMHAPHVGQLVAVRVGLAADGDERGGARAQGHHSSGGPAVRQAMSRAMLAVVRARSARSRRTTTRNMFPARSRGVVFVVKMSTNKAVQNERALPTDSTWTCLHSLCRVSTDNAQPSARHPGRRLRPQQDALQLAHSLNALRTLCVDRSRRSWSGHVYATAAS